jgi:hypothetical protein
MKIKVRFNNPKRRLKIIILRKKVPKMFTYGFTKLCGKVYKTGYLEKLNKKQYEI